MVLLGKGKTDSTASVFVDTTTRMDGCRGGPGYRIDDSLCDIIVPVSGRGLLNVSSSRAYQLIRVQYSFKQSMES